LKKINSLLMKRYLFFLVLPGLMNAQNSFTLKEAVDYAYTHNASVLNAELEQKMNKAKQNEIIGIGLPQVSGSFDIKDYLDIPTSLLPGQFFQAPPGTYIPVKFGVQYNATAGINISQIIFNSDYLVAIQASSELTALSQKNTQRSRIETNIAVSKAYYNALINRERLTLLDASLARVKKLFDDTKVLHANGFVEQIDIDRIEVAYNNLLSEREKVAKLIGISESLLKFQMGYDVTQSIELKDKLDLTTIPASEPETGQKPDYNSRIEYSLLQSQKRLNQLEKKRYQLSYLPSLFAYGSFNKNAQRDEFDVFDFSTGHDWYPISIIGVTLSVPIFSGGQKYYKLQQSKLSMMMTENNIRHFENAIQLEVSAAVVNYNNSISSLSIQKRNLELAQGVFEVAKKKYEQGVGSNLEVINAQSSLKESQTNYFNAIFEHYNAKLDMDKAKGTIK